MRGGLLITRSKITRWSETRLCDKILLPVDLNDATGALNMAVRYEQSGVISEHVKLFVKLREKAFEAFPFG